MYINQERNRRFSKFIFTFTGILLVFSQLVRLAVHNLNSLNCFCLKILVIDSLLSIGLGEIK